MKKYISLILSLFIIIIFAQVGIQTSTPNTDSDLTLGSTDKGLLLNKIALTGTASASPLSAHIAGMVVYNTATAGDVTPGFFYNDGTKWVKIGTVAAAALVETASNGLTLQSKDVQLGGALTKPTTISALTSTNKMSFIGTGVDAFNVDGTTLSVDATNNRIGIGTAAPSSGLHIVGDNNGNADDVRLSSYGASPGAALISESSRGTLAAPVNLNTNDQIGYIGLRGRINGGFSDLTTMRAEYKGDGTTNLSNLFFTTSGAERMRITETGNIAIGTFTPGTKLDVNGDVTFRESTVAVASNAATIPDGMSQVQLTGAATASVTLTAPTAPANAGKRLIVYNNTTGGFPATFSGVTIRNGQAIEFTYSNGAWRSTDGGSNSTSGATQWSTLGNAGTVATTNFIGTTDNIDFVTRTNNTERMRVQSGGNVGIGTAAPSAQLHTTGTVRFAGAGTPGASKVLTSDASGNATWETPASDATTASNGLTETGNNIELGGALTKATTVSAMTATNKMSFTGSGVDAFNVDGTTLSVDATNDRIGIGTAAPETKLHVVSTTSASNRFNLIDAPAATSENVILALRNTSANAIGNTSYLGFTNSSPTGGGAAWAIGSKQTASPATGNSEDFIISNSTGGAYIERIRVKGDTGNVGIGTSAPSAQLHTTGSVRFAGAGTPGASKVLTSDASGNATWQAEDARKKFFYAPSIVIDIATTGTGRTRNLYTDYTTNFSTPKAKNPSAPASIPTFANTDLHYYITDYDTSVLSNVSVSDTGVLTYDVISTNASACSFVTVIFVIK